MNFRILILCIAVLGYGLVARSTAEDCSTPLWTAAILESNKPLATGIFRSFHFNPSGLEEHSPGVIFLDNDRVVAHEVIFSGQFSAPSNRRPSGVYRLRAHVLNAVSGKLITVRDWPVVQDTPLHGSNSSIQPVGGGLLVRAGAVLQLYSPDLYELKEISLNQVDNDDACRVMISTTGKTVLANCWNQRISHFQVFDGSTLKEEKSWSGAALRNLYSISDTAIAAADTRQEHIGISEFGSGKWITLSNQFHPGEVQYPVLIDDNFIVHAGGRTLSVLSLQGQTVMTDHFDHETVGRKIAVARNGKLIAIALIRATGGGFWDRDITVKGIRIAVYDLASKKRALTTELMPLPKNWYDFALSPGGTKLAILNDNKVTVCSIPVV